MTNTHNKIMLLLCAILCSIGAHAQIITTYAGNSSPGYSGDGGPATNAQVGSNFWNKCDGIGNLYFSDVSGYTRRVDATGTINRFVTLTGPFATDNANDIYYINSNSVYKVSHTTSLVTTVAGNGTSGFSGDGGPATNAQLSFPTALAFDAANNMYIVDQNEQRVRIVDPAGNINTFVNKLTGATGYTGDGGPATAATVYGVQDISVSSNKLFLGDGNNNVIRVVDLISPSHIITTYAGSGAPGHSGDGGPATAANLNGSFPIATDPMGNLFIGEGNYIRKVDAATHIISTYVNVPGASGGYAGDGGPATAAQIVNVVGLSCNSTGDLFISDIGWNVRKVSAPTPTPPVTHQCIDSSWMTLCSYTDDDGNCHYKAKAHVSTVNVVRAYAWNDGSTTTTHFSHADTNCYDFVMPRCSYLDLKVTIFVADTSLADSMTDGCCQATLTQTVSCTGCCTDPKEARHTDEKAPSPSFAKGIRVYPNPASTAVTVTSSGADINSIDVLDIDGRKVATHVYKQAQTATVSLGKLPPGSYMLKINNSVSKTITKIE